jgi:hypothetical protein
MSTVKTWLLTLAGFVVFVLLAVLGRETTLVASLWAMVAVLWVLFIWFVSTVVSRRPKREEQE